jgi:hypothetical protein
VLQSLLVLNTENKIVRRGAMKILLLICLTFFVFSVEASTRASKKSLRNHLKSPLKTVTKLPLRCDKLEKQYKGEFSPLFKVVGDKSTQQCVYQQKISEENLNFFIRAAFYHKNTKVREVAFNKLDSFTCGQKLSCQDFYKIIDTHDKAAVKSQKSRGAIFSTRANSLKEKALAQINQL